LKLGLCGALLWAGTSALACELVLTEHRSGAVLKRLPMPTAHIDVAFEHSVLGTTVTDRYQFEMRAGESRAVLIEERFEGQGYGLPHAAGPGESLVREGEGWRLSLSRTVHPLVLRPLPAQRMRLLLHGRECLLAGLSQQAIEMRAVGCT
jgi:hypothetical protein